MKIIKRIAPLQLGKLLAVLYGLLFLILAPFMIVATIFEKNSNPGKIIFFIFFPLLYALLGFVGGIIIAALYNLCSKFVGGIKITLEDEDVIQSN
ncbi:MAG: DUF3566 domain-containing protein [Phycisphaerae bacterium]|jgi:hypothetical protein